MLILEWITLNRFCKCDSVKSNLLKNKKFFFCVKQNEVFFHFFNRVIGIGYPWNWKNTYYPLHVGNIWGTWSQINLSSTFYWEKYMITILWQLLWTNDSTKTSADASYINTGALVSFAQIIFAQVVEPVTVTVVVVAQTVFTTTHLYTSYPSVVEGGS